MAKENEVIIEVKALDAVKNIQDLKNNIKALKEGWIDAEGEFHKGLNELEIGTQDYADTLGELKQNQNALKDAMYATSSSMDQVSKAASGAGESYNALVHRMAALKEEFRATEDAVRRADIGGQIKEVNDQLKALDALQGNFQRNVGDYANQIGKGFKEIVGDLPKSLEAMRGPLDGIAKTTSLMGKQPIFGILALIAPLLNTIVTELKENDTAMASLKKGLDALKPISDFFASIVQKLADWLGVLIDKVVDYAPAVLGILKNIATGATGVGNAVLQFIIAPVKAAIEAFKGLGNIIRDVFHGEFGKAKEDAKAAMEGINEIFKKGISFAANFAAGQDAGAAFIDGLASPRNKKKAEEAGKELGKTAADKFLEWFYKTLSEIDARADRRYQWIESETKAIADALQDEEAVLVDGIAAMWEAEFAAEQEALERQKQQRKDFLEGMQSAVSATSSILGSLADMVEGGTEVSEREARRAKALRVASATIDMLQGATTAYSSAQVLGPPMGPIVGAANAAAVIAAGMANIAKMKAQTVSANASASGNVTPAVGTPSIAPQVSQVRTITSAREEERLNQMASEQKVYLVTSELEAKQNDTRVRLAEATF